MKQFVHTDGRVFERVETVNEAGQKIYSSIENPALKGTLPPTPIPDNTERKKLREERKRKKEERLANLYHRKQAAKKKG